MQPTSAPDLASPRFKADPYPFYARLRAEYPVYRTSVRLPDKREAWLVTRYDDVVGALRDRRLAKDPHNALQPGRAAREPWVPAVFKPLSRNMLDLDAPDHTRLRGLVHKAFSPRLVEQLTGRIQALCEELLDAAQRAAGVDLVAGYALPVPVTIIAELLGVPAADRHRFHRWSSRVVSISSARDGLLATPSVWRFVRYLRRLFERRRADPGDDLISALLRVEEAGDRLSHDELLAMVFLLLVAGHETTVNLIASGALALLQHPDQMEWLRGAPALAPKAIEELLRFVSPVEIATERYAREDMEIAGVAIPRGGLVLAVLGSANRDPQQFLRPDDLDLGREPNPHLAFGRGAHACLGAPLARLEGQIAICALLRRLPNLRLAVPAESLQWRRGAFLRGLERLPVVAAPPPASQLAAAAAGVGRT
jgi:cytochrome P450 PksS